MQKAIVAGATKALGKNVLQHKPHEFLTLQRARLRQPCFSLNVPKRDLTILIGHNVLLADHASV